MRIPVVRRNAAKKLNSAFFIRSLSLLLGVTALAMLVPLALAFAFGEKEMLRGFAIPVGFMLCLVPAILLLTRKSEEGIESSKGLLLVGLTWLMSCLLGALPYFLSGLLPNFTDAFFESASGFTTTGATLFPDIEALPRSLLFWRAMAVWLGGMGMVVLTVALAPLIGTGGFQLFRAEAPGPDKGRITPRITATAKILWIIYIALTFLQTLLLIACGMHWFDALFYSLSTIASGGVGLKNNSIAGYNAGVQWVIIFFMIIAGFNFNLLFKLIQGKGREILKSSETRSYGGIIFLAGIICTCALFSGIWNRIGSLAGAVEPSIRAALFQVVAFLTTTGFAVADYRLWPPLAQGVLFVLMAIGGCSSSTAGGIKIIRHVILFKQASNELKRQFYPRGVFSIQIDGSEGQKDIVQGVAGFIFLYFLLVIVAALFVSSAGVDLFSSFNIGLLLIGNLGVGFVQGSLDAVLYHLPGYIKWILSFVMIAGRLELWTVVSLFYWIRLTFFRIGRG